jgi:hypothetical protein
MKRRVLPKTASFHTLLKKKKGSPKRWCFERHCWSSSSPGRAKQGKKKIFLPLFSTFPFKKTPTPFQKDADQGPPLAQTFHVLEGRWRGGSTVTAPVPSSSVFAYKNRGMESKKKRGHKENIGQNCKNKQKFYFICLLVSGVRHYT